MRKILVFLVFLISATAVFTQRWENYTPEPCPDNIQHGTLTGPKTFVIKGDTIMYGGNLDPCLGCTFTFVYYDNYEFIMAQNNPGPWDYDISIVGIFYEGEGCEDCVYLNGTDKISAMLQNLYQSLFWTLNLSQDFREKIVNFDMETYYTPAECKHNGISCSSSKYCCQTYVNIERNLQTGMPLSYDWEYPEYPVDEDVPECTTNANNEPCVFKCKDIPFEPIGSMCEFPCDYGNWSDKIDVDVPVDDCPGCIIKLSYRYRNTDGPPECMPGFRDYEIVEMDMAQCNNCSLIGGERFEYCLHWLLLNGPHDKPTQPNTCINNYRIVHSACWQWRITDKLVPCSGSGCCWSIYEVCYPNVIHKINQSETDTLRCEVTNACMFMCENTFPRITEPENEIQIKNDKLSNVSFIISKNYCIAELKVENKFSGDIKVEIFDAIGNLYINDKFLKTGYELKTNINIINCISGTYYYRISQNDLLINTGTFSIVK